jgi:peptidoglycan/xylan/chitin deacetylase (PgdA/CDA1 family)/glutamine amidotransferase-like uncharacterized protein
VHQLSLRQVLCVPALCLWAIASAAQAQPASQARLRAGVFTGHGAAQTCIEQAFEALRIDPQIEPRLVSATDILNGELSALDALVLPGGGGGRQMNNLGDFATDRIKDFVREEGKGIVGLCAGAYMLTDTPDYPCLSLCGVSAVDREHDERGRGIVAFAPTPGGLEFFPELRGKEKHYLYYYEGPLMVPAASGRPFEVLAAYLTDVHLENDAPAGIMPGKPLFVRAAEGKGRVFLSSGHPEATPGMRWMVPRMVRWVCRREAIPYARSVVRPGAQTRETLFDEAVRKEEAGLFEALLYGPAEGKPKAIQRLVEIRSWEAAKWIVGGLRSQEPRTRRAAAVALAELEATWTQRDVEAALSHEKDAEPLATLEFSRARLIAMTPAVDQKPAPGPAREVAVTFDDLPAVSVPGETRQAWTRLTERLVSTLRSEKVPATGFVNGDKLLGRDGAPEKWREDLLRTWLDAGMDLGNHTHSHAVLHQVTVEQFEQDVVRGEEPLRGLLAERDKRLRYFRYPCLQTGRDEAVKSTVRRFLQERGYLNAPVTIDNSEWIFARAYSNCLKAGDAPEARRIRAAYLPYMEAKLDYFERQSRELLGREVRQILLLHANALNADALPDLLAMLRRRGYTFIRLDRALQDEAYALPDGYYGPAGISWLHRWCFALGGKHLVLQGEGRCASWVMDLAGVDSE